MRPRPLLKSKISPDNDPPVDTESHAALLDILYTVYCKTNTVQYLRHASLSCDNREVKTDVTAKGKKLLLILFSFPLILKLIQ